MHCPTCDRLTPPRVAFHPMRNGARHLEARCALCHRWLGWLPQTPENLRLLDEHADTRPGKALGAPATARNPLEEARRPSAQASAALRAILCDSELPVVDAAKPPTWADLVALVEPRLAELLAAARAVPAGRGYCADRAWYGSNGQGGFGARLRALVGWCSGRSGLLGTAAAHDMAAAKVYGALPRCGRCCGCSWLSWCRRAALAGESHTRPLPTRRAPRRRDQLGPPGRRKKFWNSENKICRAGVSPGEGENATANDARHGRPAGGRQEFPVEIGICGRP
jgi:hypothetical protein